MKLKPMYISALAVLLVSFCPTASFAGDFVTFPAPNSLNSSEGNSLGSFPFGGAIIGMRYQQVFDASQFSPIASGGGFITYIGFRLDGGSGGESAASQSLQINFSTTPKTPDGLSPNFADNIGHDDTVVRGARGVTLVGGGGGTPQPFEPSLIITLDTPFFYNPSAGNLLMDVRNYSGVDPSLPHSLVLDAQDTTGDSVSSILAFNVNSTSGSLSSSGFVTDFGIQIVPEPGVLSFFVVGLAGFAVVGVRTRLKRRKNAAH